MDFAMCLCIYLLSSTSNLKVSRLKTVSLDTVLLDIKVRSPLHSVCVFEKKANRKTHALGVSKPVQFLS